jgi:hypothetical protein
MWVDVAKTIAPRLSFIGSSSRGQVIDGQQEAGLGAVIVLPVSGLPRKGGGVGLRSGRGHARMTVTRTAEKIA